MKKLEWKRWYGEARREIKAEVAKAVARGEYEGCRTIIVPLIPPDILGDLVFEPFLFDATCHLPMVKFEVTVDDIIGTDKEDRDGQRCGYTGHN